MHLSLMGIAAKLQVQLIDTLASDMGYYMDRAAQYLHVVVSLLVFFAKTGDAVVKAYMAKATVLEGLVASMEFLPPELILEICPSASRNMQKKCHPFKSEFLLRADKKPHLFQNLASSMLR